ncbi:MAG: hypothetical protein HN600_12080 [Bacteroidetes bacterium]|nr:hypothetical protein [Bacteroidota bacterium]
MKKVIFSLIAFVLMAGPVLSQEEEVVEEVVEMLKPTPAGITADLVIQNYIAAIGGEKKMLKMKSLTMYAHTTIQGTELMFTFHRMDPGKYYMEMGTADMTYQKQICDGKKAKIVAMGNETEITGSDLEAVKYEGAINKELRYKELGVTYKLLGVEELNGKDAYFMEFTIPGGSIQNEYFDIESALKVRTTSTISAPEGDFMSIIDYSNYKAVKGVLFPFAIKQSVAGQEIDLTVSSIILNKVDASVFEIK